MALAACEDPHCSALLQGIWGVDPAIVGKQIAKNTKYINTMASMLYLTNLSALWLRNKNDTLSAARINAPKRLTNGNPGWFASFTSKQLSCSSLNHLWTEKQMLSCTIVENLGMTMYIQRSSVNVCGKHVWKLLWLRVEMLRQELQFGRNRGLGFLSFGFEQL
jgi:hypothetical protein